MPPISAYTGPSTALAFRRRSFVMRSVSVSQPGRAPPWLRESALAALSWAATRMRTSYSLASISPGRFIEMWKLILAAAVAALALMNVARVDRKNMPANPADSIEAHTHMPPNVAAIFHRACQDCHTESTYWPWYSKVAPFHWLIAADV